MPSVLVETPAAVTLTGGLLEYMLRRTPRARGMRVTIHPSRGVIVSVPPATRRGWAHPEPHVEAFLRSRETWIRRHLGNQRAQRQALDARPELEAGRRIPYRGVGHLVRIVPGRPGVRRSHVTAVLGLEGWELLVQVPVRDRHRVAAVLEAWFREQAREAIDQAVARHAPALGVAPRAISLRDPRSRWGSCSRAGRLSFSWRLVLATPEALESVVAHELCHLRVFGHGRRFHELLTARIPGAPRWRRWLHEHGSSLQEALTANDRSAAA